jgi:hypothetical protein
VPGLQGRAGRAAAAAAAGARPPGAARARARRPAARQGQPGGGPDAAALPELVTVTARSG